MYNNRHEKNYGPVAQLVEHLTFNQVVARSTRARLINLQALLKRQGLLIMRRKLTPA